MAGYLKEEKIFELGKLLVKAKTERNNACAEIARIIKAMDVANEIYLSGQGSSEDFIRFIQSSSNAMIDLILTEKEEIKNYKEDLKTK